MKICCIVSDFPKVTETFALANVQEFRAAGHAAQVFHIKPFRSHEIVHPEAREVVDDAMHFGYFTLQTFGLAVRRALRRPMGVVRVVRHIVKAFWSQPRHLAVSMMLVPQALALAQKAKEDGVDFLYAEFAGYPATVAWIASRMTGIPFGFSAHAHDIFITQSLLSQKARDAVFVRTISDFNRRFLVEKAHVPMDKISVIRCGVVPALADAPAPEAPADGQPFQLLFVGALLPRKGVDVLLKALAWLPKDTDWRLRIIGGGSQEAALRDLAKTLPEGRVTFDGAQPSDVVHEAMAQAHLVIVPSIEGAEGRSEGIPVVLMEAMAHGRPVIASRLSGIPELVQAGVTGYLVAPGEVQALSTAIGRVMEEYPSALGLARAGQARVLADYNIGKNANALLELIRESK